MLPGSSVRNLPEETRGLERSPQLTFFFFFFCALRLAELWSRALRRDHRSIGHYCGTGVARPRRPRRSATPTTPHLQLGVLHLVLRLAELRVEQAVGDPQGAVGHEQNGELELSNKLSWGGK